MDSENQNPFFSLHLPVTLIALALTLFFALNISGAKQTAENLQWQNTNNTNQIAALKLQREGNEKTLEQNKQYVATAEQTRKQFEEIAKDLLEIANAGDEDAKLICKTYGIAANDTAPAPVEKKDDKKDEKKNP